MSANALLYQRKPQAALDRTARANALYNEGGRLRRLGNLDGAITAYDGALKLRPAFPEALRAAADILRELGNTEGALRFLGEAIRQRPSYIDAVLDRGNLLCACYRFDEALATFDAALEQSPNDKVLLVNRGIVLHDLGRLSDACTSLEAAIDSDPSFPEAHLNYGNALARAWRHEDALIALARTIELRPFYPAAYSSLGISLLMLGRLDEADAALATAITQEPDNPYALTNRGRLRLLRGDYEGGLADYEHRLRTQWEHLALLPAHVAPCWSGQPLVGQRVVAIADQGNGDIIQYARFLPDLLRSGAKVTVICRPRLRRLLRTPTEGARVVESIEVDERFDLQIPFTSLPFVFSARRHTIPAAPYIAAEADLVARWAKQLGPRGYKIGLCWRGSQEWRADPRRSIPLDLFRPLASITGVRLISLHVDADDTACSTLALEHFAGVDTGDDAFIDTAAIIANLDLVVTCDTSIAHLAGALARPTFVLLQAVPEWRWLADGDETPWYPSMRLFRQRHGESWADAIGRLALSVEERVVSRPPAVDSD